MENGIENISKESIDFYYEKQKKNEEIKKHDAVGIGVTVIAMGTVFLALLMLTLIFNNTARLLRLGQSLFRKKEDATTLTTISSTKKNQEQISGEEYAAIAAAIYVYSSELHDEENTILTIEKTTRAWTPWNAKYFNMNTYFMKNGR